MNRKEIIARLREQGWNVEVQQADRVRWPASIAARHPVLPAALSNFLAGLTLCVDATQTTWFLCECDYNGESGAAFHWDEWEQMSLAASAGDEQATAQVLAFWDAHLPFMLSVRDGYSYWAIRTVSDGFGKVVTGREPEFEQVSDVADSFEDFLSLLLH